MVSALSCDTVLSDCVAIVAHTPSTKEVSPTVSKNEGDYFSLSRSKDPRAAILSPAWPRLPSTSPTTTHYAVATSLSASTSSKGSWSSLFNTGSVRQFMSGVHESISTPLDTIPSGITISIPQRETVPRLPSMDSPRHLRRRDQGSNGSPISKSWSETQIVSPINRPPSFPTANIGRRPERAQVANVKQTIQEKKLVVEEELESRVQQ